MSSIRPSKFHCWFLTLFFSALHKFSRMGWKVKSQWSFSLFILALLLGFFCWLLSLPPTGSLCEWLWKQQNSAPLSTQHHRTSDENSSRKWKFVYAAKRTFLLSLDPSCVLMLHSFSSFQHSSTTWTRWLNGMRRLNVVKIIFWSWVDFDPTRRRTSQRCQQKFRSILLLSWLILLQNKHIELERAERQHKKKTQTCSVSKKKTS